MPFPSDINQAQIWAGEYNHISSPASLGAVNLVLFGTNPPYTASDFLAMYPRFGGTPVTVTGTLTEGITTLSVDTITGISSGQIIIGTGIPSGTTIASVAEGEITLSQAATSSGTGITLTVYPSPLVPLFVLNVYINLASATLQQARWLDMWLVAMGLFVAHYLTLYLRSEGNPATTLGAAALAGLEKGITVSKSVGDVATTSQLIDSVQEWGAWAETTYGTQLVTIAKTVGMGPILIR